MSLWARNSLIAGGIALFCSIPSAISDDWLQKPKEAYNFYRSAQAPSETRTQEVCFDCTREDSLIFEVGRVLRRVEEENTIGNSDLLKDKITRLEEAHTLALSDASPACPSCYLFDRDHRFLDPRLDVEKKVFIFEGEIDLKNISTIRYSSSENTVTYFKITKGSEDYLARVDVPKSTQGRPSRGQISFYKVGKIEFDKSKKVSRNIVGGFYQNSSGDGSATNLNYGIHLVQRFHGDSASYALPEKAVLLDFKQDTKIDFIGIGGIKSTASASTAGASADVNLVGKDNNAIVGAKVSGTQASVVVPFKDVRVFYTDITSEGEINLSLEDVTSVIHLQYLKSDGHVKSDLGVIRHTEGVKRERRESSYSSRTITAFEMPTQIEISYARDDRDQRTFVKFNVLTR